MGFLSSCCSWHTASNHELSVGDSTGRDPSTSSCSIAGRELGRVGHTGFTPPSNLLSLEKISLSTYGLSAPSEERVKIPLPMLYSCRCVWKPTQTLPLTLTTQTLLYTLSRVTYWSWIKSYDKNCLSWGQEAFEAGRWMPFFLSKCVPAVLTTPKLSLWLSSICMRFCSISPFTLEIKLPCHDPSTEQVLADFTKLKIVSITDTTVPTYLKLNIKLVTIFKEHKNANKIPMWQCQILCDSYDLKP